MLLSGWTQPVSAPGKEDKSIGNGGSASDASIAAVEAENDEVGIVSTGKKRKSSDGSEVAGSALSNAADGARNHKQLQVIDDEDDLVVLDGSSESFKKKRLQ